jgi:hypothetical protein
VTVSIDRSPFALHTTQTSQWDGEIHRRRCAARRRYDDKSHGRDKGETSGPKKPVALHCRLPFVTLSTYFDLKRLSVFAERVSVQRSVSNR